MTSAGVPFGTKIHQVALADPEGVAIVFAAEDGSERTVTFGELDDRSTQLARVLSARGLTVGDHVAVCAPQLCQSTSWRPSRDGRSVPSSSRCGGTSPSGSETGCLRSSGPAWSSMPGT